MITVPYGLGENPSSCAPLTQNGISYKTATMQIQHCCTHMKIHDTNIQIYTVSGASRKEQINNNRKILACSSWLPNPDVQTFCQQDTPFLLQHPGKKK